jgi:hypothetical protein
MGGGLLQLVAYGAQDAYITGNPHITFWKVLYKRHTNFAMEAMRVNFTGAPSYGQRSVVVVNRNADLMFRTYLEVTLPDTRYIGLQGAPALTTPTTSFGGAVTVSATSDPSLSNVGVQWTTGGRRRLGYLLIQQVEIEIGGQVMDRHYGEWMYLWESLAAPYDQAERLDHMMGYNAEARLTTPQTCGGRPTVMYIPLSFWFCRNPGLALPLIALQYHEVRLNFIFRQATDLVQNVAGTNTYGSQVYWPGGVAQAAQLLPRFKDAAVYIDYIYLDTDERRRFAQQSHEYLIDQLQYGLQQSITSQTVRLDLTLNHPVKELVWVFQDARMLDCSLIANSDVGNRNIGGFGTAFNTLPFQYSDIVNRCRLQLNGQDRFDERYGDYFWKVQPYQHHSGGAFEQHAYTQQPLVGNAVGSSFMTFTATTNGTQTLSAFAYSSGMPLAQAAGLTFTIVNAVLPATGVPTITPGTTITFPTSGVAPTTNALSANAITSASNAFFHAVFEPNAPLDNLAGNNALAGGIISGVAANTNYAVAGYQQTNQTYTQSVNPINMYSFSLAPEEHQPSGSCNFSRIDTTTLVFDTITSGAAGSFPSKNFPYLFRMYAVNYNIFRVMSGMGGLAYSN